MDTRLEDATGTSTFPGWATKDWQKLPEMENQHSADYQDGLSRCGRAAGR